MSNTPKVVVGHYYRLKSSSYGYCGLKRGDIVKLVKDEGDDEPAFYHPNITRPSVGLGPNIKYIWLNDVEYIGENDKVEIQKVPKVVGALYCIEVENPHYSPLSRTDIVELVYDDGSNTPIFYNKYYNLTHTYDDKDYHNTKFMNMSDLRYIGKMVIGDQYKLLFDKNDVNKGDTVKLVEVEDDCGLFYHPNFDSFEGHKAYIHLSKVEHVSAMCSVENPSDLKSRNNSGGNNGRCVSCGTELTEWAGAFSVGWFCKKCEG